MKFTELKIYASTMGLEAVGGVLDSAGVSCCSIQDPADLEALLADRTVPADYVEESLRAQNGEPFLSVYLAQNAQGEEQKNAILAGIETLRGDFGDTLGSLRVETAEVCDDDWRDNWKQFFHPLEIGERFVVRPSWEPYAGCRALEIVIDPESSFGTGQHETTRLCLSALEMLDVAGKSVLDMGCGSGILGIGALKLGASHVTAVDIDSNAAAIAERNFERNGVPSAEVLAGNVLTDSALREQVAGRRYDIILANIVADVIREMLPLFAETLAPGGTLLCSGIIAPRAGEITEALESCGFCPTGAVQENDWVSLTAQRANG